MPLVHHEVRSAENAVCAFFFLWQIGVRAQANGVVIVKYTGMGGKQQEIEQVYTDLTRNNQEANIEQVNTSCKRRITGQWWRQGYNKKDNKNIGCLLP